MSLPLPARLYLATIALAAAGLQVFAARHWSGAWDGMPTHFIALFGALAALGVLAQHFPLEAGGGRKIDVTAAVYFAAVLLLGTPAGMALVGLVQLLGQATLCLRRNPLSGKPRCTPTAVVFNTAQFMLAAGLSGLAYFAWFPHTAPAPFDRFENLWAIPA